MFNLNSLVYLAFIVIICFFAVFVLPWWFVAIVFALASPVGIWLIYATHRVQQLNEFLDSQKSTLTFERKKK